MAVALRLAEEVTIDRLPQDLWPCVAEPGEEPRRPEDHSGPVPTNRPVAGVLAGGDVR